MAKEFNLENLEKEVIGKRVRSILGVPESFLVDDVISSPEIYDKTIKYINKNIKDYLDELPEDYDKGLLDIASMYYMSYLLCVGMDARLPKQMENLSTKTILQNINWDEKAMELLDRCQEAISDFLDEYDVDEGNLYGTVVDLSDETSYPESNI